MGKVCLTDTERTPNASIAWETGPDSLFKKVRVCKVGLPGMTVSNWATA